MEPKEIGRALAAIRERAGYTLRGFADALGVPSSSYATYERGKFKKGYLPMEKIASWAPHLVGRGDPPVTMAEMIALGTVAPASRLGLGVSNHQNIQQESEDAVLAAIWADMEDTDKRLAIRLLKGILLTS